MLRRTFLTVIAGAVSLAAGVVTPIALATGGTHVRTVHTQLKVLGQAKPACHAGLCVIRNHGSGTMSGFGRVTFTTRITDDLKPAGPCPKGSWVPRVQRRIETHKGTLVLNEAGLVCPEPGVGPRVDLVWVADGAVSTGAFAHATGSGVDHAYLMHDIASQAGQIVLGG